MTQHAEPSPTRAARYRTVLVVGVTLLVLSLCGSGLAAPFLFPLLQGVLLIPMLPAAIVGFIGGRRQAWWITLGLTFAGLIVHVIYNVAMEPFGYAVMYDTYIRGQPPVGLKYFHSWMHLFDATILLLCPGVAITTHALIERRRFLKLDARKQAARCQGCGYLLRGLLEPRCPECGQAFDPAEVAEAMRVVDEPAPGARSELEQPRPNPPLAKGRE